MTRLPRASESLSRIDASIAALRDPRDRLMLKLFRDHWWAEVVVDVDKLIALMPDDDSTYYFGGCSLLIPEPIVHHGPREIRAMFQAVADLGVPVAGPFEEERYAFADWGMAFEATLSSIYPGKFLPGRPGLESEQLYFVKWKTMSSYPIDVSRNVMRGGNVYMGSLVHLEPVHKESIEIMLS
jgi:hypothetical protein